MDSRSGFRPLEVQNLVIVGSGPAGFTAAIYAARANLNPVLVTGFQVGGIPGGQLMTTTFVENFPGFPDGVLGPELMDLMKAQAIRWGTELVEGDVESIDLSKKPFLVKVDEKFIQTHSLIIATGASANRLGLPNEKKYWTRGISACAICDGATPQFRKEALAVVGGGDSACEEAVYLTKYGSHVHLIVRSNRLRASAAMTDRVLSNSSITVHWETEVIDVEGADWLESLQLRRKGSSNDESIFVRGLFYAIGHKPNTEFLADQLKTDSNGYLLTNPGRSETSVQGVFAAGDVSDFEWRQGVTAAASGCKAALSAERWLSKKNLSNLVLREVLEPAQVPKTTVISTTTKENYKSDAIWQKGSYALRKLYHDSKNPLLVVYTSSTCGPCHVLKPQIMRVLQELEGKAQGVEIDIDSDLEIAEQAGVTGTPMVQLFKGKSLKAQWKGVKPRSEFKTAIIEQF